MNLNLIIEFMLVTILIWIAFEDFKYREISLWAVLFVGVVGVVLFAFKFEKSSINDLILNISFLGLLFLSLGLYSFKKGVRVFDQVAEGDWLILIALCLFFDLSGFVTLITISCFSSIFVLLGFRLVKQRMLTIPLAGILCLATCIEIGLKYLMESLAFPVVIQSYIIK